MQPVDAVDGDRRRAEPADARSHPVEHVPEKDDLRLAGGVDDRRAPAGQRGRHEQILGAGVARVVHVDGDAAQPRGAPGDLLTVVVEVDGGAHLAEAAHVDVDRARAELAAAGRRGRHLAASRQQRTGDEERGAHGGDELGRGVGVDRCWRRGRGRVCARRSCSVSAPRLRSSASIVPMSARSGTLLRTHSSAVSNVAASAGRAAFLAPPMVTAPRSGTPPRTRSTRSAGAGSGAIALRGA